MNILLGILFQNELKLICLHKIKWFQVLICNTNDSISVICLHMVKWLNSSIWPIDGTLICSTIPSHSGPESNGNEEVPHIPQIFKTRPSPSDAV